MLSTRFQELSAQACPSGESCAKKFDCEFIHIIKKIYRRPTTLCGNQLLYGVCQDVYCEDVHYRPTTGSCEFARKFGHRYIDESIERSTRKEKERLVEEDKKEREQKIKLEYMKAWGKKLGFKLEPCFEQYSGHAYRKKDDPPRTYLTIDGTCIFYYGEIDTTTRIESGYISGSDVSHSKLHKIPIYRAIEDIYYKYYQSCEQAQAEGKPIPPRPEVSKSYFSYSGN